MMRKVIILLAMTLALATFASAQVERKYDRFKDETSISIVLGKVPMDANFNSLTWMMETTFAGEKIPADPIARMSIITTSREWRLLRADLTMRAIIDGERVLIGEFKRNYSNVYGGAVIESASMIVAIETLKKMVSGKDMELQFMSIEMRATQVELDKIKAFLDALK